MADNANVVLDTAKMRAVARVLENQASIIKNCYDSINSDALFLKGAHWEGESADAYCESMKALCSEMQAEGKVSAGSIVDILKKHAHNLHFTADEYDRNEGKVSERVKGLPVSVFGV